MKLLLDQNLSPNLIAPLINQYPGSIHVRDVGLQNGSDDDVWNYAKKNDLVIVSKDYDFHQRSFLFGAPPKVIWIKRGNCSTSTILTVLLHHHKDLADFEKDNQASFMILE